MGDPVSFVGLSSLFNTCLEVYKICLSIQSADDDVKTLRTRMLLEQQRFLSVGRTCGLLQGEDGKTDAMRQFLAEDAFRRKTIEDSVELVAALMGKAEDIHQKYATPGGLPEALKEKDTVQGLLAEKFEQLKVSLRKVTWSIRDRAAYEDILRHLAGCNTSLEKLLPGQLQDFLKAALPATICATSSDDELSRLGDVAANHRLARESFLPSQVEWSSAVHGVTASKMGPELSQSAIKMTELLAKDKNRYMAVDEAKRCLLVDWTPSEANEKATRVATISGLLGTDRCRILRMLRCAGYLEVADVKAQAYRYALVYELSGKPRKVKTLLQLLESFRTVQLPSLDMRLVLARILCRTMLRHHASGWIHHDFRSHNIIFTDRALPGVSGLETSVLGYQGLDIGEPYVIGFGHAREEADVSLMFADKKAVNKTLKQQKRYWSPDYLASSKEKRTNRSFQRSHDIYSLGCVLLEIGLWRPLESYSWDDRYDADQDQWHRRLLKEESKLQAMCGSRYTDAVMRCLKWTAADIVTDVTALAFDILLMLEEISV